MASFSFRPKYRVWIAWGESDFNLITRIARQYNCAAKLVILQAAISVMSQWKASMSFTKPKLPRMLANIYCQAGVFVSALNVRKINGGLSGLADRLELWGRARRVLCA
ncbi:hypothetical protein SAMN03159453_00202 [Pseudomonas sp. NFIX28]|nr:hypothetical protein SAMN03159453_00202 [Pseudomonas sp. NFIX28]